MKSLFLFNGKSSQNYFRIRSAELCRVLWYSKFKFATQAKKMDHFKFKVWSNFLFFMNIEVDEHWTPNILKMKQKKSHFAHCFAHIFDVPVFRISPSHAKIMYAQCTKCTIYIVYCAENSVRQQQVIFSIYLHKRFLFRQRFCSLTECFGFKFGSNESLATDLHCTLGHVV